MNDNITGRKNWKQTLENNFLFIYADKRTKTNIITQSRKFCEQEKITSQNRLLYIFI